jgi:predicted GIY-YIG superfamily endonuclease
MARKRKSVAVKRTPTYTIYVIELSRDCVKEPCTLAPLYVGQTAHDPEHRFAQHKAGGKLAAVKAHRYGVRLRWDLMKRIAPCTSRADAEQAERAVAEALERRGHRVFWG